jgi:hypothetical protein
MRRDNGTTQKSAPAMWFAVARYRPLVITPGAIPRVGPAFAAFVSSARKRFSNQRCTNYLIIS